MGIFTAVVGGWLDGLALLCFACALTRLLVEVEREEVRSGWLFVVGAE